MSFLQKGANRIAQTASRLVDTATQLSRNASTSWQGAKASAQGEVTLQLSKLTTQGGPRAPGADDVRDWADRLHPGRPALEAQIASVRAASGLAPNPGEDARLAQNALAATVAHYVSLLGADNLKDVHRELQQLVPLRLGPSARHAFETTRDGARELASRLQELAERDESGAEPDGASAELGLGPRRSQLLADLLDWRSKDSALSRLVVRDATAVARGMAERVCVSPRSSTASMDEPTARSQAVAQHLPPAIGPIRTGADVLRRDSILNTLATRALDTFMEPDNDQLLHDAAQLRQSAEALRAGLSRATDDFLQRARAGSLDEVSTAAHAYANAADALVRNAGKAFSRASERRQLGLTPGQDQLQDHMVDRLTDVFKHSKNIGVVLGLTSLATSQITGTPTHSALRQLITAGTAFAGGTVAQEFVAKQVANFDSEVGYHAPYAVRAAPDVLDRKMQRLETQYVDRRIDRANPTYLERRIEDLGLQIGQRMDAARTWFQDSQHNAARFASQLQGSGAWDLMVDLKRAFGATPVPELDGIDAGRDGLHARAEEQLMGGLSVLVRGEEKQPATGAPEIGAPWAGLVLTLGEIAERLPAGEVRERFERRIHALEPGATAPMAWHQQAAKNLLDPLQVGAQMASESADLRRLANSAASGATQAQGPDRAATGLNKTLACSAILGGLGAMAGGMVNAGVTGSTGNPLFGAAAAWGVGAVVQQATSKYTGYMLTKENAISNATALLSRAADTSRIVPSDDELKAMIRQPDPALLQHRRAKSRDTVMLARLHTLAAQAAEHHQRHGQVLLAALMESDLPRPHANGAGVLAELRSAQNEYVAAAQRGVDQRSTQARLNKSRADVQALDDALRPMLGPRPAGVRAPTENWGAKRYENRADKDMARATAAAKRLAQVQDEVVEALEHRITALQKKHPGFALPESDWGDLCAALLLPLPHPALAPKLDALKQKLLAAHTLTAQPVQALIGSLGEHLTPQRQAAIAHNLQATNQGVKRAEEEAHHFLQSVARFKSGDFEGIDSRDVGFFSLLTRNYTSELKMLRDARNTGLNTADRISGYLLLRSLAGGNLAAMLGSLLVTQFADNALKFNLRPGEWKATASGAGLISAAANQATLAPGGTFEGAGDLRSRQTQTSQEQVGTALDIGLGEAQALAARELFLNATTSTHITHPLLQSKAAHAPFGTDRGQALVTKAGNFVKAGANKVADTLTHEANVLNAFANLHETLASTRARNQRAKGADLDGAGQQLAAQAAAKVETPAGWSGPVAPQPRERQF